MHPYRLIVLTGVGFGVLSMLLPFASLPVRGPVDGLSADAWPALIALTPVVFIALNNRWDDGLESISAITAVGCAGMALVFAVVKVADAVVAVRDTAGATLGPGGWILVASCVAAVAGAAYGALVRR